jgi:D-aminopeptidase
MGRTRDLLVAGQQVGQRIAERQAAVKDPVPDGSIIVILATDIPLCERQLGRIAKRALIGLARTGSQIDSGSGEITIAFSTANRINHYEDSAIDQIQRLNEERLNDVFRAVAECTEEAILNSMLMATTTSGIGGHVAYSLAEYLQELAIIPTAINRENSNL